MLLAIESLEKEIRALKDAVLKGVFGTRSIVGDAVINMEAALAVIKETAESKDAEPVISIQAIRDALWWVEEGLNNVDMDALDRKKTKSCRDELKEFINQHEKEPLAEPRAHNSRCTCYTSQDLDKVTAGCPVHGGERTEGIINKRLQIAPGCRVDKISEMTEDVFYGEYKGHEIEINRKGIYAVINLCTPFPFIGRSGFCSNRKT